MKRKLTRGEVAGSALNVAHLCSLMAYSIFGLTSSREENYPSSFVYGASLITFFSYFVLYCADVNKLSSSILEKEGKEGTGTYLAKVGVMGIILPVFNLIALIFLFMKIRQDAKTFWSGIAAFIFYFLGNTLLFFSKGENTESEEHELRENNLPADNTPVSNSPAFDSPVNTLPMNNSPPANLPVNNASAANSPVDNSSVHNSPAENSPAENSPRPSIRTFP